MTSAGIIAFCGILTFVGLKSSYWIWKVLAGIAYWGLGAWWVISPIGGDSTSPVQSIMLMVTFFTGIACYFWAFWTTKYSNGIEVSGRLRIPFMQNDEEEESESKRRFLPTRKARVNAYLSRLEGGERNRRG